MRLQRLAAACIAAVFIAAAPAARADLLIHVDKSTQRMTVSADGQWLYTWPVSTGGAGYNSPSGEFMPFRMSRKHVSHEYDNAPMPYSIFFHHGDAIHGTYEVRYLGEPVSHGCVRLSVRHAAILWGLVKQYGRTNTKVVLTGNIQPATTVARRAYRNDDDVTGSLPTRAQRWRESRRGERYYEAEARPYYGPPRYAGPPPIFPFFLFMSPGR